MSVFLPYMIGSGISLFASSYLYEYITTPSITPSLTPHSIAPLPKNKTISLINDKEEEIIFENIEKNKKKNIID